MFNRESVFRWSIGTWTYGKKNKKKQTNNYRYNNLSADATKSKFFNS
jgi:hypothetical protein